MGWVYTTAVGTIYSGQGLLTSVLFSGHPSAALSSPAMTLYNATAATAGKEILHMHASTAQYTIAWDCGRGIQFDNLYLDVHCACVTVVWD